AQIAGVAAFLGHCFPIYLRFRGGKGVATFLGTLLALSFPLGAAACLSWLVCAGVFRISSLAALVAAGSVPVWALWLRPEAWVFGAALAVLIFYRHEANIRRLLAGDEPRIGGK
ncbi:MAG: glycerol-3-phosphate acyltransferase, partial [Pseudomonadota bacterium]